MTEVNESEIVDRHLVCPYCMNVVSEGMLGHCGESSGHFERAIELTNGEMHLENEISVKKGT